MARTTPFALGIAALFTLAHAAAFAEEPVLSTTRILERAVQDASAPGGHDALDGLRRMNDPALRPMFSWLASAKSTGQRRQGVLGLAQLETPPRISPLLLSRLTDPAEQAALLGEGLSLDLVGPEQIDQILAWPNLEPYIELMLRARLAREGKPIDHARIEALAEKGGMTTELLAAALLAQAGLPDRINSISGRLLSISDPERGALVKPFLETIRRERLSKATPILSHLSIAYSNYPSLAADVLKTWVRLAPEEGLPILKKEWEKSKGLPDHLRLALVALDVSDVIEPSLFAPIEESKEHPALSAMGRLGGVLARKEPPLPALHDLIELKYLPAELWIVNRAKQWDEPTRAETSRAILTAWATRSSVVDPISDAFLPAAEMLVDLDRDFLASTLVKACERNDERVALGIVMALLSKGAPPVWDANAPPRWPDKATEAVALLVFARGVAPAKFPPDLIPALEGLATGAGTRLPAPMRSQASWALIKIRGQEEQTLARLLAGDN